MKRRKDTLEFFRKKVLIPELVWIMRKVDICKKELLHVLFVHIFSKIEITFSMSKQKKEIYKSLYLCITRLLVYHSLLIQQTLFIHNNNKKRYKLQENLRRIENYWCQKSSFFSRIVSCFKNQIAVFVNFTFIFLYTWIQMCKLHRWTNRQKLLW